MTLYLYQIYITFEGHFPISMTCSANEQELTSSYIQAVTSFNTNGIDITVYTDMIKIIMTTINSVAPKRQSENEKKL